MADEQNDTARGLLMHHDEQAYIDHWMELITNRPTGDDLVEALRKEYRYMSVLLGVKLIKSATHRDTDREAIGTLVGEASMLFGPGVGEFDTTRAENIIERILRFVPTREEPLLGYASTAQLIVELKARVDLGKLGQAGDYRTIDNDE